MAESLGRKIACGLMVLFLVAACRNAAAASPRDLIPPPDAPDLRTLAQHWTDAQADWFYNVPQGSKLIPYDWFLHLEVPDAPEAFRSDDHIRSLGYLPRKASDTNPDGLPVGFAKDDDHLGFTCAACHTALIKFGAHSWIIDGGPTLADVARFQRELAESLKKSMAGEKFERFAAKVLGSAASEADKAGLKAQMGKVLSLREEYNRKNLPLGAAPPFGPGRVDAFGAILNQVTTNVAGLAANAQPADAPVSYPFLWDTPHHDRVQWNGAAKNTKLPLLTPLFGTEHIGALGRNTGEVLGVFGTADANTNELLIPRGYPSSVKTANLVEIEENVRRLWSPVWPNELGAIDASLRDAGRNLFQKHCLACHADIDRDADSRKVEASLRAVGTDQTMARNFATRTAKAGRFSGRLVRIPGIHRFPDDDPAPVADFLTHAVQRVLLDAAHGRPFVPSLVPHLADYDLNYSVAAEVEVDGTRMSGIFRDFEFSDGEMKKGTLLLRQRPSDLRLTHRGETILLDQDSLEDKLELLQSKFKEMALGNLVKPDVEFSASGDVVIRLTPLKRPTVRFAYKGRPLNGIWATAPYLHNGSVPNLDELLKPAAQRMKKFRVGSHQFDPTAVGYRTDQGNFEFDATLPGNSNAGHEYGDKVFTETERRQLVEYMKSL